MSGILGINHYTIKEKGLVKRGKGIYASLLSDVTYHKYNIEDLEVLPVIRHYFFFLISVFAVVGEYPMRIS